MQITHINYKELKSLASGSGLAKFGNNYYAVGDDSPFLFMLDENLEILSKTRLIESDSPIGERIKKAEKPDFEAMEIIEEKELIIFGSGSKSPQRDICLQVLLENPIQIKKHQLSEFYDSLRSLPILKHSELNIEAVSYHNKQLFLFNRKKNLILKFDYKQFLNYIKGESKLPKPEIKQYFLPEINGIEAGFSGASILKNQAKIIFTASVEATENAYDDGEILGSFIGSIDLSRDKLGAIQDYCQIPNAQTALKVESVTIKQEVSFNKTRVVMLTDDDKGNSIGIEALLQW